MRWLSTQRLSIPARWPFDVRASPIYYGWVILAMSTLGFLMSIPGQTMGMGVFTDHFMAAFGLSRVQLSIAYFLGTTGSALFLTRAGRLYDHIGARSIIVAASVLLGICVVFLSLIDVLSFALGGEHFAGYVAFVLLTCGYFGVRFAGQGVLTSASRNLLLVWFVRRRGLVAGIRSLFVSLGFSLAPLLLALLITALTWREALWVIGAIVGIGFAALALLLVRNNPQECGLLPDGDRLGDDATQLQAIPSKSLFEARRSPVFWIYTIGLAVHALFGTALTFHIVDIFAVAGRSSTEAFAYFVPAALASTSTNFFASYIADYIRLKPLLLLMLAAFILGAWGMLHLESFTGYWLLVAGFGMGGGLWGVLSNLANIRFFGPLHLGEISGLNTSVTVFASAIGPMIFSFSRDLSGSYAATQWGCLVALIVLLVAAAIIPQHELANPTHTH